MKILSRMYCQSGRLVALHLLLAYLGAFAFWSAAHFGIRRYTALIFKVEPFYVFHLCTLLSIPACSSDSFRRKTVSAQL